MPLDGDVPVLPWVLHLAVAQLPVAPRPEPVELGHVSYEPLDHIMFNALGLDEVAAPEAYGAPSAHLLPRAH